MAPDVMVLIEAVKQRRQAAGFAVRHGEFTGYFRTEAEREDYMRRATSHGFTPEVVTDPEPRT